MAYPTAKGCSVPYLLIEIYSNKLLTHPRSAELGIYPILSLGDDFTKRAARTERGKGIGA
jgi:hypothetical protein